MIKLLHMGYVDFCENLSQLKGVLGCEKKMRREE